MYNFHGSRCIVVLNIVQQITINLSNVGLIELWVCVTRHVALLNDSYRLPESLYLFAQNGLYHLIHHSFSDLQNIRQVRIVSIRAHSTIERRRNSPESGGVQGVEIGRAVQGVAPVTRQAGRGGGRDGGAVDVQAGVLLLPLGPSILEPDLHLRFRQIESQCEVQPLADG